MPRLTIIGNSHVAALKDAWDRIAADHPGWQVTFFAAASQHFRHLRLTPELEFGLPAQVAEADPATWRAVRAVNRRASTDLAAADLVLWAGYRRPLTSVARFVERRDVEGLLATGAGPAIPRAEFDAFCDGLAEAHLPDAAWLDWKRPRLVLHSATNPAETLLAADDPKLAPWAALAVRPGGRETLAAFVERYAAALARRGVGLLRQPEDTLLPSGLTAATYAAGSRRLRNGASHPQTDHVHLNAAYGRRALASLFETFAAQFPAEPALTEDPGGDLAAEAAPEPDGDDPRPRWKRRHRSAAGEVRPLPTAIGSAVEPGAAPARVTGARTAGNGDDTANPYADLPPRAYWRTGVAERAPLDPGDLYQPRFAIDRSMRVATAGSCFAQHVGRALRDAGVDVIDTERLPLAVPDAVAQRFGYRLFSARYANIYTARQLLQLYSEALEQVTPAIPVWRKGARFVDAQRPTVEPDGLDSPDAVLEHRRRHLGCVRRAFAAADLFVFTFGLTEAWEHRETGTVYPTAPGVAAGGFDPETYAFRNFDALETLQDFEAFRALLKRANPQVRFLVTVSPVPLTATASGAHVEVATCYSKATLRAVCGMLVARYDDVDYFPSFELITSTNARGAYYEANQRSVSRAGVDAAMGLFLRTHGIEAAPAAAAPRRGRGPAREEEVCEDEVCEEALLEAFAP